MMSAIQNRRVQAGTVILGDLTIQGNIKGPASIMEPLQVALDNGAFRVLVPVANKAQFAGAAGGCGGEARSGLLWRRRPGGGEGARPRLTVERTACGCTTRHYRAGREGDDLVIPAEMPALPTAAREAGIDSLHLGRKAVENLGQEAQQPSATSSTAGSSAELAGMPWGAMAARRPGVSCKSSSRSAMPKTSTGRASGPRATFRSSLGW